MAPRRSVFASGATGYVGRPMIESLLAQGHVVRGLARRGSELKLPTGCGCVVGDALDAASFAAKVTPADTYVHMVGVAHPSPAKAAQFRTVDLVALKASVRAASAASVHHFIYVSVAHPAPMMKAYIEVRKECEEIIRDSGLAATILRPWYILGPGHRWPYLLLPMYKIAEKIPSLRDGAMRLGLVTLEEMIAALVAAVNNPSSGVRILEVPEIRSAANSGGSLAFAA